MIIRVAVGEMGDDEFDQFLVSFWTDEGGRDHAFVEIQAQIFLPKVPGWDTTHLHAYSPGVRFSKPNRLEHLRARLANEGVSDSDRDLFVRTYVQALEEFQQSKKS